ncbi:MAG: hypothetical protein WA087_01035 [Candidatus Saccharimonadales bacterium]
MLLHGSQLIGTPIMSLQTGTELGRTKAPVIDPANLKILAYQAEGPMLVDNPSYIRIADVRELSNIGMIIDSNDEFVTPEDVISLKKIIDLNFNLVGLNVIDETKRKLGKIDGYNIDSESFVIQQIVIKQGVIKSLSETELLVHRSQIVEINDQEVIIKSGVKKLAPITKPSQLDYINPFKSPSPQPEGAEAAKTN